MLDSSWSAVDGPFADNVAGLITAETLRDFAADVGSDAVNAEWFETLSADVDESQYTTDVVDTVVDVWFADADPAPTRTRSASWTVGEVDDSGLGAAIWEYEETGTALLHVNFQDTTNGAPVVALQGLEADVLVQPIVSVGTLASVDTGTWVTHVIGAGETDGTGGSVTHSISASASIMLPASYRFVRLGIRLTPDSGSYVADDASLVCDFGDTEALVVARPLAATV